MLPGIPSARATCRMTSCTYVTYSTDIVNALMSRCRRWIHSHSLMTFLTLALANVSVHPLTCVVGEVRNNGARCDCSVHNKLIVFSSSSGRLLLHLAACFTQSLLSTDSHSPIKRFARLVAHTRAKRITATQWTEMYEQRALYVVLSDCKLSLCYSYGLSFMIWWTDGSIGIGRSNLEFCVLYETHCSSYSNEPVQAGHK